MPPQEMQVRPGAALPCDRDDPCVAPASLQLDKASRPERFGRRGHLCESDVLERNAARFLEHEPHELALFVAQLGHRRSSESFGRVAAFIKVAECSASEQREPASALMLGTVVQHVAPLAEGFQVRGPVVGRVVIKMRARQDHPRSPHRHSP